ncbi:MAG: AAA family ATPase [Candidatus Omnitrophota bacterium]|jgi:hypothetical protein
MLINDEVSLLIKSKYPVVYFEAMDENFALRQLRATAEQLELIFYQWSLTDGLKRGDKESSYYQTKEPVKMIRTVVEFVKTAETGPGLFVLKDFEKYLEDPLVLRLFKDAINYARNTKNTFVLLSAEYKVPKDIEPDLAHIFGGYPAEEEIKSAINETIEELKRTNKKMQVSLDIDGFSKIVNILKGLTIQQIRNILNQCALDDNCININDIEVIENCKKKIFDQEGLLEFYLTESKDNIANFDNLKRWLQERKFSFEKEKTSALPPPKGVLLMGVQGCGKSMAVKVIAREIGLPLYRIDIGKLYSKYIGETEQNLRKALAIVDKLSPICLWLDEIEKGFAASSGDIDGGVSQRILGTFLTWMQERKSYCFIAATANDIYRLPPEFLRKGRFDEMFFVDLPDVELRKSVFSIHICKRGLNPSDFSLESLAEVSEGFSGAEIEQAIISALYRATSEKKNMVTEHIIEQIKSTKPLSVVKSEEIEALREWAKERTIPA